MNVCLRMETIAHIFILFLLTALPSGQSHSLCKCMPWDSCWPDSPTWQAFNSSIGGRLLSPKPWAWPCHLPGYDAAACRAARRLRTNAYERAANVGAMQAPNWEAGLHTTGCPLGPGNGTIPSLTPCYQGDVPIYAVNVSHASHVQAAIFYANLHNLRLVIKSSGHDYLGRSTAPGSLCIWLYHLKKVTLHESFLPFGCSTGESFPAVTAGPGVAWIDVYNLLDANNRVVVGPNGASVSAAGGYVQGGGHSPLSRRLGLAVDNVLEFTVVMADGVVRVANRYVNRDLFWALSGGGGGTYGVVLSATYRTYPAFSSYVLSFYVAASADEESQKSLISKLIEVTPSMDEAGLAGYFYVYTNYILLAFVLPNGTASDAQTAFLPLVSYVDMHPRLVTLNYSVTTYGTFLEWHRALLCPQQPESCTDPTGTSVRLATRFISRDMIERSGAVVTERFMEILYKRSFSPIFVLFVLGGEVANRRGENNSVSEVWRSALWHVSLSSTWNESVSVEEVREIGRYLTQTNEVLREITPGGGCYKNEADYYEPEWQESFFGEKYSMLRAVKESVDPTGLFVCWKCVGSENWMQQCA